MGCFKGSCILGTAAEVMFQFHSSRNHRGMCLSKNETGKQKLTDFRSFVISAMLMTGVHFSGCGSTFNGFAAIHG